MLARHPAGGPARHPAGRAHNCSSKMGVFFVTLPRHQERQTQSPKEQKNDLFAFARIPCPAESGTAGMNGRANRVEAH